MKRLQTILFSALCCIALNGCGLLDLASAPIKAAGATVSAAGEVTSTTIKTAGKAIPGE